MEVVMIKDDGTKETIKDFILIKVEGMSGRYEPRSSAKTSYFSNIDPLYVSQILGDHSRWQWEKVKL